MFSYLWYCKRVRLKSVEAGKGAAVLVLLLGTGNTRKPAVACSPVGNTSR